MNKSKISMAVAIGISFFVVQSYAAEKKIEIEKKIDLDGRKGLNSEAFHLSNDGQIIAGKMTTAMGDDNVFHWITNSGMTNIGTIQPNNQGQVSINGLSRDGSTIIGIAQTKYGNDTAVRWTKSSGLVPLIGAGISYAQAVSRDGNVITGQISMGPNATAFVWENGKDTVSFKTIGTLRADPLVIPTLIASQQMAQQL